MSNIGRARSNQPISQPQTAETQAPSSPAASAQPSGLSIGARGAEVRTLQQGLKQLGFLSGTADGIFGRMTQTGVAGFQRANGLDPTGTADAATLAKLEEKLASSTSAPPLSPSADKSLLFVGMGDGAKAEAQFLKGKTAVTSITDAAKDDQITLKVGGRTKTYDLTKKDGCDAYARDLGLRGAKADEVSKIIHNAGDDARDEVAQLAKAFNEAQLGKRHIERMVISGHSVGGGVWGDTNGYLELKTIGDLAKAFPAAARQVEDFMVAGCYSGGESAMEKFRAMFPNLKTSWAYTGSAPGTWSGAMPHLQRFEQGTRGHDPNTLSRNLARSTRKGENVAVWTATKGYDDGQPMRPLPDLRRSYEGGISGYRDFFRGQRTVTDTQTGPLRDHYNSIQRLLQHPQLPASERPTLEAARDSTIRLLFYDGTIKGKFQAAHADKVNAGFAAVGLPAPNFAQLSRAEALAQVERFEAALASKNPKPAAAQTLLPLLTEGLRDLKPSRIPNTWV